MPDIGAILLGEADIAAAIDGNGEIEHVADPADDRVTVSVEQDLGARGAARAERVEARGSTLRTEVQCKFRRARAVRTE